MEIPYIIEGGTHTDERGRISFINNFDMSLVKRLYFTEHFSVDIIRAWQAHIVEKRWFLCVEGSFVVRLVEIDEIKNPSDDLEVKEYKLNAETPQVLYIPNGFANGFKAIKNNSKLIIFSDYAIGVNEGDQVRFDKNKWTTW